MTTAASYDQSPEAKAAHAARMRAWRAAHPKASAAAGRRYRENHPGLDAERHRLFGATHPEVIAQRNHAYRESHSTEVAAQRRVYLAAHREEVRTQWRERKRLRRASAYPRMEPWPTDCQVCGKPIDADLVYPDRLAETPGHEPPIAWLDRHPEYPGTCVIRPEHWGCNQAKGDRPDWELPFNPGDPVAVAIAAGEIR
jgi:hypothetical protein